VKSSLNAAMTPEAGEEGGAVVSLQQVTKIYPDGNVQALAGVTLDLPEQAFVSVMGPSGSGKSTLLNLIGGLDLPTSGRVLFRGQSLATHQQLDKLRSQTIGFVFQTFHLLPNLTARENVQLPMFGDGRSDAQRESSAAELLALVGMADRQQHLPGQLSIGQRQRVAIARALANQPALLLADEPTGSLDSASGTAVMDLLSRLHRELGMALVVVTHDKTVASRADRTLHMLDGRVVGDTVAS
jgi:ABC-type lipoprotein export system ATPase subunit